LNQWCTEGRRGRVAPGGRKKKKREEKRLKGEQERQKERVNNSLSSLLMPLWFYRLYRDAKGRILLSVYILKAMSYRAYE